MNTTASNRPRRKRAGREVISGVLLFLVGLIIPGPLPAKSPPILEKVTLRPDPQQFRITLFLTSAVPYDAFIIENPTRFVLNLYGAKHRIRKLPDWPADRGVKKIRVSQYMKCPNCIVRLVAELEGERANWKTTTRVSGKRLEVTLHPLRAGASPSVPAEKPPPMPSGSAQTAYRLGPGDLLDIQVFELPNIQFTMRVAPDGTISMVPLGRFKVEGMTPTELEHYLKTRLQKDYIQDPHVSVNVREFMSQQVTIIGAVHKPGSYPLFGYRTVLAALADAGGLVEASGTTAYLYRRAADGTYRQYRIDLHRLLDEGDLSADIPLQSGDIVSVPLQQVEVYVYGAVQNPGVVRGPYPFTVLRALAAAGGPGERAALGSVRIIHPDGKVEKVDIGDIAGGKKKDVILQRGDVVFVPTSLF